ALVRRHVPEDLRQVAAVQRVGQPDLLVRRQIAENLGALLRRQYRQHAPDIASFQARNAVRDVSRVRLVEQLPQTRDVALREQFAHGDGEVLALHGPPPETAVSAAAVNRSRGITGSHGAAGNGGSYRFFRCRCASDYW